MFLFSPETTSVLIWCRINKLKWRKLGVVHLRKNMFYDSSTASSMNKTIPVPPVVWWSSAEGLSEQLVHHLVLDRKHSRSLRKQSLLDQDSS